MNKKTSGKTFGQAGDNQGFTPVASLLCYVRAKLRYQARNATDIKGMPTGFKSLDTYTDGLHRGELMVIGAHPATGKSALIANLAVRTATFVHTYSIAITSAELSGEEMILRMIASETKVNLERLRTGQLEGHDGEQLKTASNMLRDACIMMDEAPQSLVAMRKNLADIKHGDTGLDIVLVDDLQSLAERMGIKQSAKGMASLMRGLHTIARDLDVAVIVTARLNAAVKSRADKRPRISDLYQSRAIEAEADVIMLLYRDEMYHHRPEYEGLMECIIVKHNHGKSGTAQLVFWPECSRFEDVPAPDNKAVDAVFDMIRETASQRIKEMDMNHHDAEMRYLTKDFPNLALPDKRAVCPIEIDLTALADNEQYKDGGWEDLIRTIAATWVEQHAYTGRGTIWAWGTPSANFGYQNFSMFYAVLGMPASFRKFLGRKISVLGKHVRPDSDYVIPNREDGWNAVCHVEDGKAWEPIDPTLWQEVQNRRLRRSIA